MPASWWRECGFKVTGWAVRHHPKSTFSMRGARCGGHEHGVEGKGNTRNLQSFFAILALPILLIRLIRPIVRILGAGTDGMRHYFSDLPLHFADCVLRYGIKLNSPEIFK